MIEFTGALLIICLNIKSRWISFVWLAASHRAQLWGFNIVTHTYRCVVNQNLDGFILRSSDLGLLN